MIPVVTAPPRSPGRIIFVNRVYWPSQAATAQLLTDLAEELAARGLDVHVVSAGREPGPRHGVVIHRTGPGETHGGLFSRALNYGKFLLGARRVVSTMTQPGDVVVLMTDPPLLAAALTGPARRARANVVHWIQDIYPEIVPAHAGAWAAWLLLPLRWARNRAWRAAARCVPVSADMADMVVAQGIDRGAVTVAHNWAPRELHAPADPAAIAARRQEWGFADKFIVVYSGNLGRVHEFTTIIAAAALLQDQTDIVFLFIGSGARFEEVRAAAAQQQLGNIHFRPPTPREHLAAALGAADAHLVTLKTGFERLVSPSKLAGILAAGRPALFIGPGGTEISRLLATSSCGISVTPTDSGALIAAIKRWRDQPEERIAAGRSARVCYENNFTLAQAVRHWEQLLDAARAPEQAIGLTTNDPNP